MLFSLYLSVLSTLVCAIVADYYSLLLSRALVGICIGLGSSTIYVMIAELASEKAILNDLLMISAVMYAIGGVWSAGLGYLLLDLTNWRIFILLTSRPLFIPPIFMLHFSYLETSEQPDEQNQGIPEGTIDVPPNFIARTIKLGLFDGTNIFQGWLTIVALLNVIAFTVMLAKESLVVVAVSNFMVKFLYGFSTMTINYILADIDYFGTEKFALGAGISSAIGMAGGMLGTALVAFTPKSYVIITALVINAINILLVFSMSEVK